MTGTDPSGSAPAGASAATVAPGSPGVGSTDPSEAYRRLVVQQVREGQRYFARQMRAYRAARIVVITTAALVPVLSAVESVPKWVLGILGAVAAATESISQLYRWRDSAIAAQKMGNQLEQQLNLYATSTPPYDDDATAPALFVQRIEAIRGTGADAFVGLWAEDRPPTGQGGPSGTGPPPAATRA